MPSKRPTYSNEQLEKYLDHIKIPKEQWNLDVSTLSPDQTLEYLTLLQKYHICAVPFENFAIHYSPHHGVIIDPMYVFDKIVRADDNRGGYCTENNQLFYTVLLSLGFEVYSGAARVSAGKGHDANAHQISFVIISGQKYLLDVGYGSGGALQPIAIPASPKDGTTSAEVSHIKPGTNRIIYRNIEEFTRSDQLVWELQYHRNADAPWSDCYAFTENEFLPSDYAAMNLATSTSPGSLFTQTLLGVKYTMDENKEITGQVIIHGDRLKYEVHHEKVMVIDGFRSEEDRAQALGKWFNIKLTDLELRSIKDAPGALKPSGRGWRALESVQPVHDAEEKP